MESLQGYSAHSRTLLLFTVWFGALQSMSLTLQSGIHRQWHIAHWFGQSHPPPEIYIILSIACYCLFFRPSIHDSSTHPSGKVYRCTEPVITCSVAGWLPPGLRVPQPLTVASWPAYDSAGVNIQQKLGRKISVLSKKLLDIFSALFSPKKPTFLFILRIIFAPVTGRRRGDRRGSRSWTVDRK